MENTAYLASDNTWWFEEEISPCCAEVIAWMPLPEPYEVER